MHWNRWLIPRAPIAGCRHARPPDWRGGRHSASFAQSIVRATSSPMPGRVTATPTPSRHPSTSSTSGACRPSPTARSPLADARPTPCPRATSIRRRRPATPSLRRPSRVTLLPIAPCGVGFTIRLRPVRDVREKWRRSTGLPAGRKAWRSTRRRRASRHGGACAGAGTMSDAKSLTGFPASSALQATLIRKWKPWEQSTGPRTHARKAKVSRNTYKGNTQRNL
jgi:hypothetical protein